VLVACKVTLRCVIPQKSVVLSYFTAEDLNDALHTSMERLLLYIMSRDTKYFVSNDILLDS
jgi:hypothetical protein